LGKKIPTNGMASRLEGNIEKAEAYQLKAVDKWPLLERV
jgi:hypothetical protein